MSTDENKSFSGSAARILSILFHPLLMPVYGLVIIFSAPTLFGYMPYDIKRLLLLIVFVNNVFLPLSLLPFFMYRNIISSWTINKREERKIPLIMATILYAASSYIIFRFPLPSFLKSYIYSIFFLSLVSTVINFWWKISLHSIASGALIAIILVLSYRMYTPLTGYLIAAVIVGGGVLSSRLRLNYNSPQQVWFGFLTGFLGLSLFMMVI